MKHVVLNAAQLRAVADYAASLRSPEGEDVYITATYGEDGFLILGHEAVGRHEKPPRDAVVRCDTRDVTPDRPAVVTAEFGTAEATLNLAARYDAVFWSEAAVEKFVLPYYASKSLWMAGHVLDVLSAKWYGRVPGQPAILDTMPEIPFALAHLPSSDYVALDSASEPLTGGVAGSDLILLAVDPIAQVITETPLSVYL
jgi:hypothetical protein